MKQDGIDFDALRDLYALEAQLGNLSAFGIMLVRLLQTDLLGSDGRCVTNMAAIFQMDEHAFRHYTGELSRRGLVVVDSKLANKTKLYSTTSLGDSIVTLLGRAIMVSAGDASLSHFKEVKDNIDLLFETSHFRLGHLLMMIAMDDGPKRAIDLLRLLGESSMSAINSRKKTLLRAGIIRQNRDNTWSLTVAGRDLLYTMRIQ